MPSKAYEAVVGMAHLVVNYQMGKEEAIQDGGGDRWAICMCLTIRSFSTN